MPGCVRKKVNALSEIRVCNGVKDCLDNSDEWDCVTTCPDEQWKCKDGSKCVSQIYVCDGWNSCSDNSDELNCTTCPDERPWKCKTGSKCIRQSDVCNGWIDCDNSDELNCTTCKDGAVMCGCLSNQTTCKPTGQCIKRNQLSDGVNDCTREEDEPCLNSTSDSSLLSWRCLNESKKNTLLSYLAGSTCKKIFGPCGHRRDERCETGEWLCSAANLEYSYQLDDGAFANTFRRCLSPIIGFGFKCVEETISQRPKTCILPQSNIYDDIPHCGDDSDLCFVEGEFKCFLCLDERLVISQQQVCDGIVDCYDLSDECLCGNQTVCEAILGDARDTCHANQIHCHNETDCVDIEEALCHKEVSCVRQSNVWCNSSHNQNLLDQKITWCSLAPAPHHFFPLENQLEESPVEDHVQVLPWVDQNLITTEEMSVELVLYIQVPYHFTGVIMPTATATCDGRPECNGFLDECETCEERPPFCDDSCSIKNANNGTVCGGLIDPNTGEAFCNETRKKLCPKRHNCRNNKVYTSIDVDQVCDGIIHCDDESDELVSRCKETRFYCVNKQPLSVDISLVEDGLQQCSDGSDECPDVSKYDTVFSNVKEMIGNPFYRAMFWVMGFLAGGGNFIVFVTTINEIITDKKAKVIKKMNNLFIINLSCADFLMGVYLLGIAAKGVRLSGNYCLNGAAWRTSNTCNIFGFIALFASEASALILATMTACRLYTVCNPFATRTLKLKWAYLSCITVWASSFLLGAIPLFYYPSGYFTSHVWFPNLFYKTDRVPRNETLLLAKRIMKENFTDLPWYEVKQLISSTFPQYPIKGEFGYFGETSVCMPRLFASVNEASWQYSIFLISLNFVLFIVMLISYLVIYIKSNKMSKAKKKQANTKMQRRISRLLITDFCCWIPLCTCGFLAVSGVPLTNDIYIVSAGILLPINSALNPLLYSNLFDNFHIRCKRLVISKTQNPKSEVEANV